jgi:hypothetical protein
VRARLYRSGGRALRVPGHVSGYLNMLLQYAYKQKINQWTAVNRIVGHGTVPKRMRI